MIEERLGLINQWFNGWDEFYRIKCLDLLLNNCSVNLLQYVKYEATKKLRYAPPTQVVDSRQDFTRNLPRHLCLKILGYLDPRSLCRCSLVCWYWKYLSESDELWQAKCVKLGWTLDLTNVQMMTWKKCYQLKLISIRNGSTVADQVDDSIAETTTINVLDNVGDKIEGGNKSKITKAKVVTKNVQSSNKNRSRERIQRSIKKKEPKEPTVPPWRPSGGNPEDMHFDKFNKYLNKRRTDQRRSRSAVPGSKSKISNSLSSSQQNIQDNTEWNQTDDNANTYNGIGDKQPEVATKLGTREWTPTANYDEQRTATVEETIERKIRKELFLYETTDKLSQLQQNQNGVPWNYTEVLSDEDYDDRP